MKLPKLITSLLASAIAVILAGCITATPRKITSADFGPYPTAYENDIRNLLNGMVKDPVSLHYSFGTPRKGWVQDDLLPGGKKRHGWIVPVGVNEKSRTGSYTGKNLYHFMIAEGQVAKLAANWEFIN